MSIKFPKIINSILLILIIFKMESLQAQDVYDTGFADYLFKNKEYYRAITEYYRNIYCLRDSTKKTVLLRNIGLCYFHGADYEGMISFVYGNRKFFQTDSNLCAEMDFYTGKSYYRLCRYREAISILERNIISPENRFFDEVQFLLGLCYARTFDWQTAIQKMILITHDYPKKNLAERFGRSLRNFPNLPKRNPFLAGVLSGVVPGAGYFYCDRKETAVTSLVINGLLFWAVRDALKHKQVGLSAAIGFFGIGWYIGNIKGSIAAAKTFNINIRQQFIDYLLDME